ncbi:phage gp6-like head-tail connector protein [Salmonella enterica subsp. enterica serovar Oranienburg]|uniref:Phage gp6-like head-tail connector protein n=1 Tax=Salmonella oranienberg TaxID=28147 RepID=A0A5I4QNW3_SALON|nr:phage gp6-like head-tail connector protein [Salmonella enterica subsp. enterica serovar Oranienburg]EBY7639387.1 phage gp6-like head-tail connector protein [Salmonella enterica subsp. enterica serovar Oranienburg]EBZ5718312.1 phage gp6-like head-tail connector protein [Salmonella enterica subsp. enterica serovar Oranienburg]ECG3955989.1 phage gp6-like head-tail connector protein [Salmonella enterica subsp. enterica serovar Oranienburg]EDR1862582.1 phage gp6-like head-tail connector protein [
MNERELSLIKALGEEFGTAIQKMADDFQQALEKTASNMEKQLDELRGSIPEVQPVEIPDVSKMVSEAVSAIELKAPELPDVNQMVNDAVSNAVKQIRIPEDGKSVTIDDVSPLLQKMVNDAVAEIPLPKDGKDCTTEDIIQAVDAVVAKLPKPQDGKSVTVEELRPLVEEVVKSSIPDPVDVEQLAENVVAKIPVPEPAVDGKDALAIELEPFIDEKKSYPRGTYATHNGGLWRSHEKTHGMRGWECIVDGVSNVDIQQENERTFSISLQKASGAVEVKSFNVPVTIYRDVFKAGTEYQPGDTVTWGGSMWHCNEATSDKPGETGSKGWTLAVKKGRDLRDKP